MDIPKNNYITQNTTIQATDRLNGARGYTGLSSFVKGWIIGKMKMTEQEIGIKIVQDLATKAKRYLLKTLNGELLKKPHDELMKELDQNYLDYCEYIKHLQYMLFVLFGLNVNMEFGAITINLGENND